MSVHSALNLLRSHPRILQPTRAVVRPKNKEALNGTPIRLYGEAAREGDAKPPNAAILIPVVSPLTALRHGTDAVIKQGTPFTAFLYADTPLVPAE